MDKERGLTSEFLLTRSQLLDVNSSDCRLSLSMVVECGRGDRMNGSVVGGCVVIRRRRRRWDEDDQQQVGGRNYLLLLRSGGESDRRAKRNFSNLLVQTERMLKIETSCRSMAITKIHEMQD